MSGLSVLIMYVCIVSVSGFGDLRDNNDASCTYEGDNNVLLQQTSKILLTMWENKNFTNELGYLNFLKNIKPTQKHPTTAQLNKQDYTKCELSPYIIAVHKETVQIQYKAKSPSKMRTSFQKILYISFISTPPASLSLNGSYCKCYIIVMY